MADDERPPLSSFEARPPLSSFEQAGEAKPAAKGYFGNLSDIVSGAVSDIGESRKQTQGHPSSVLTDWAREGADVAAIAGAPFTAAYKTAAPYVAGPMASGIQTVGEPIAKALNPKAELPTHEQVTEAITPDVERALGTFGARGVPAPMTVPVPRPVGPLGVTLTEGQATRNLPLIQREQAAVRGQSGPPAEARAQQFVAQQQAETQAAREDVGRSFDPALQQVAQTPHEAGDIISQGLQQEAAARRAEYGHLYETARSTPGEIHANIFNNMGDTVRADLASAAGPTIDDALSPFASRALRDLDNGPAIMEGIRGMQPSPHFSLADADLLRKRLSLYRRGATNAYDRTATQSVIDAFDNRIDRAVNSGAFNGDPRGVQAWNDARAAYADYRRTFTGGRNDPVGRVVEKIIGRDAVGNLAAGPATPNEVADFLSGGIGINAKGVQVGVSNRIRQIFGGNSPQWSAVKQGLWSRVLERPQGVTEWGPRQQANRLNEFLNGKGRDLAEAVYAPPERDLMRAYADLMDRIAVPQAGANWSNSATFVQQALNRIGSTVGTLVGSAVGHYMGLPLGAAEAAGYAVTKGTQAIGRYSEMRRIARQMPLVGQQIGRWQRAVNRSAAAGILAPATATNAARAADGLSKALAKLGVAAASQDDKKEREPRGQQKGGRINAQRQRFADGGAPDDPYDPLAASAGIAPAGSTPVGSAMLQHTIDLAAAPGRVAAGQQSQTPGMWSDLDEAQAQANARGLQVGAPEAATMMMGSGTPFAMAEHGALGITGGRLPVGEAKAPPLYSAVERAVAEAKTPQAPAQQWLGTLKNAPGVKPEELETLGVEDFLKGQKGPVTKQALAEHIAENKVDVQEVEKGGDPLAGNDLAQEIARSYIHPEHLQTSDDVAQARRFNSNFRVTTEGYSDADVIEAARLAHEASGKSQTKFGQYTLPGGENYRELLLTLPWRNRAGEIYSQRFRDISDKYGGIQGPELVSRWTPEESAELSRLAQAADKQNTQTFKSAHWDEPNVLAHVRFDDRNIGGDKTLHMAEVQSDWHQKGRREGYQVSANPQRMKELEVARDKAAEQFGWGSPQWRAADRAYADIRLNADNAVPDAPFKTTWPELALKRMIRYAAENGYDRISWDTGLTNAERYDLSKQIKRLEYSPTHNLRAWSTEGKAVIDEAVPPEKLPDYIGKEAADKLMNAPTFESGAGRQVKYLEGMDLKVGGEGMKAFYDRMLPNVANKLVKKYGARVEQSQISSGDVSRWDLVSAGDNRWVLLDRETGEQLPNYFRSGAAAERWLANEGLSNSPAHSIKITPELRDQALHRGFPMFSTGIPIPPHSTDKRETQGFAKGGAVNGKATKAAAEYKTKGHPPRICANCTMFRPPSFCTAVKGQISPQAVCRFFEAKKGRASDGRIDASHTVRTGANSSADGTVYVDPRIPAKFRKFLAVHETVEAKHMAGGYARAHKIATAAERKAVEASGMSWRHYTAEMDGYLDHIEHEKDTNPPKGKLHVSAGVALGHHRSGNK